MGAARQQNLARVLGGLKGLRRVEISSKGMGSQQSEQPEAAEERLFDPGWLSLPSLAGAFPVLCFWCRGFWELTF